ncbi:GNAT family N-acetyltransferase [Desemzia sp. RIT804]|uniref:GNAT family N-acetyltransferase n=1 Tax=Desemzia sp. RIT 804 TaxID=2810209 RepID=UPI001950F37D|nr:GNAT family N-acetyltransferase [Desemzia sp. RIT 804]MBM6613634.1 GNAT family N-acetyltransferase [Desemzia sp. RIT 804]
MEKITLREAVIEDAPKLENYAIDSNPYITKPMDALTESMHETEKHPILILKEDELIGFFILQLGVGVSEYTDNPKAILFKAHSIDLNYQGEGYAKKSLELLSDYVRYHYPFINEIVLSVSIDNISSQMLYVRSGFSSNQKRINIGESVEFVLSKNLDE